MSDLKTLVNDMSGAAAALLDGLSPEQRDKINLPFEDEATRRLWYYTPTPRPGLPLGEMNAVQQQAVRRLMGMGLSTPGYNFAATVMGLEYMVDQWSGFPTRTYGEMPGTVVRDPANYCVAIFGTPGNDAGWGWRIGGHHLNLHYTLANGFVSPTPAFFGAEPSHVPMPGGATMRALAAEEDLARELVTSLNPDQRAGAVISPIAATDVVQTNRPRIEEGALYQIGGGGPGGQGLREKLGLTPELDERLRYTTASKGIAGASLQDNQRELLSRLVGVYLEHVAEPIQAQYTSLLDPERMPHPTSPGPAPLSTVNPTTTASRATASSSSTTAPRTTPTTPTASGATLRATSARTCWPSTTRPHTDSAAVFRRVPTCGARQAGID